MTTGTFTATADLAFLASSYARHLRAEGKSSRTITNYLEAISMLDRFLDAGNMPRTAAGISREHVELFMADLLARFKATSAHNPIPGIGDVLALV